MRHGLTFLICAIAATPCFADPMSPWNGIPIQQVIDVWGQPSEVHEPWKIMQQQELSEHSAKYLAGSPYAATARVGRPSNPDYIDKITVYVFRHPTVHNGRLNATIELRVDEQGKLTRGVGVEGAPCTFHLRPDFMQWLKGEADPACLESTNDQ